MFPSPSANYLRTLSPSLYVGRLFRHKLHPIKLRPFCVFPRLASKNIYERKKSWGKQIELLNKNRKGKLEPIGLRITKSQKPVAQIFHGMTLRQFASILDKELDELGEHILENGIAKAEKYLEKPDEAMDWELLLEIVATLRMRPKVVDPPKEHSEGYSTTNLDLLPQPPIPKSEWQKRAPVVTIMGHVDHGKTTLLDALRHSNIVSNEFGGITQHIGAFSVKLPDVANKSVTFLDTPGHAAFKSMRERGARATDIVVLVVAADDGVMEQTIESINYAREAGVPIIVAVNKCDKPRVDQEKVLNELLQQDVIPEKYGGETQVVEMSALYKKGIDKLQEAILIQAELLELHSTPKGPVEATIIESSKIQGLGIVTTLIVNRGTLKRGTVLVASTSWAKVRSMTNEFNENVKEAGPSTPVRISGWHYELPSLGELALEAPNEGRAQSVVDYRKTIKQETIFTKDMELIEKKKEEVRRLYEQKRIENFQKGIFNKTGDPPPAYTIKTEEEKAAAKVPTFSLIIKCDVDGSLEAIQDVLATYNAADQVRLDIVNSNVGILTENDLEMAGEFNAHIFTFNTPIPARIHELARHKNVHIEEFHVIYKFVQRLKELLSAQIKAEVEKHHLGEGTVLVEYRLSEGMKKRQPVAGIRVDSGVMDKKGIWRFTRIDHKKEEGPNDANESTVVIYEGHIESMQHQKQPINQAKIDMEIGIAVEDKNVRYKEDDRVECYENVVVKQKIGWDPPGF